ncbi:MAG: DUF1761 domain-containing protein [Patescibacteria group bacterium]|jgi:hypothetical protein
MPDVTINYVAVLVSGLIAMVLGGLWYSPVLFGKVWARIANIDEAAAKKEAPLAYVKMFILALISAWVLAHFVDYTQSTTFMNGALTGFWVWLGFVATVTMSGVIFEKRPSKLWFLNNGYQLILLVITGGVLAIWS